MNSILKYEMMTKGSLSVKATGVSMSPSIKEGDNVVVIEKRRYEKGDIVLFNYKGELLIHRLVRTGYSFWCKGDNSLRIETIELNDIIGYVLTVNGVPPKRAEDSFVRASLELGVMFIRNHFDKETTIASSEYVTYKKQYLHES